MNVPRLVISFTDLSRSRGVKEEPGVPRGALQKAAIYIAHLGNGLSAGRNDSRSLAILMRN